MQHKSVTNEYKWRAGKDTGVTNWMETTRGTALLASSPSRWIPVSQTQSFLDSSLPPPGLKGAPAASPTHETFCHRNLGLRGSPEVLRKQKPRLPWGPVDLSLVRHKTALQETLTTSFSFPTFHGSDVTIMYLR